MTVKKGFTIEAYGYRVLADEYIIQEIKEYLCDRNVSINWNNFGRVDIYYDNNGYGHRILVDHRDKTVVFTGK